MITKFDSSLNLSPNSSPNSSPNTLGNIPLQNGEYNFSWFLLPSPHLLLTLPLLLSSTYLLVSSYTMITNLIFSPQLCHPSILVTASSTYLFLSSSAISSNFLRSTCKRNIWVIRTPQSKTNLHHGGPALFGAIWACVSLSTHLDNDEKGWGFAMWWNSKNQSIEPQ